MAPAFDMQVTDTRQPTSTLAGVRGVPQALINLARPRQWVKNVIVFGPLVFAHSLFEGNLLGHSIATFASFCLVSSAIYAFNDVLDVENDKQHPTKRFRPLPSGQINVPLALMWGALLGVIGLSLAMSVDVASGLMALAYVALMVAYSTKLKHLVILDVFAISGGFILRAVAGALAIHVIISPWLYVCTMLLTLFLGFGKRYNELAILDDSAALHRRNLEDYSPAMLEQMTSILIASTIMAYSLYTFSADSLPADHSMMLTIPFTLYGIFRYYYLVHKKSLGGAPEQVLLHDRPLLITVVLWGAVSIGVLYSGGLSLVL